MLSEYLMRKLIREAKKLFDREHNIVRVYNEVVIIGDIHGQFMDMIGMFNQIEKARKINDVADLKHLFLGNYVNYGKHSCEVLSYLLALKVRHP